MKGLEALKHINKNIIVSQEYIDEDINIIEKELKALEIIINKQVAVDELLRCIQKEDIPLEAYNDFAGDNSLTQKQFDLLKEELL